MSDTISTCPVCNETLPLQAASCPRCGYKMPGATEAFSPVSVEERPNSVPVLQVTKGPYSGQEFVMGEGTFTIGRDPSCDFFLNNTTVSRRHAVITVERDRARIVDNGSLNGTWVDGAVVDAAPLVSGSKVQIGSFEMMFKRKIL